MYVLEMCMFSLQNTVHSEFLIILCIEQTIRAMQTTSTWQSCLPHVQRGWSRWIGATWASQNEMVSSLRFGWAAMNHSRPVTMTHTVAIWWLKFMERRNGHCFHLLRRTAFIPRGYLMKNQVCSVKWMCRIPTTRGSLASHKQFVTK